MAHSFCDRLRRMPCGVGNSARQSLTARPSASSDSSISTSPCKKSRLQTAPHQLAINAPLIRVNLKNYNPLPNLDLKVRYAKMLSNPNSEKDRRRSLAR